MASVKEALSTVRVIGPDGGGHWGVHDALGESAVIEYVKGELRWHNNTAVGVMTNDPPQEWHL